MWHKWLNTKEKKTIFYCIIGALVVITYIFILLHFDTVSSTTSKILGLLTPFLYGFAMAYIINPMMSWIERKLNAKKPHKYSRLIAMILVYILILSAIALCFLLVLPQVITSLLKLMGTLPENIDTATVWVVTNIRELLANIIRDSTQIDAIQSSLQDWVSNLLSGVSLLVPQLLQTAITLTNTVLNLFLGFVISIYMLWHKDTFRKQFKRIIKAHFEYSGYTKIFDLLSKLHTKMHQFIQSTIIDAFIIGSLCYIGCLVLNINNAILIAVIVGVTNVIPFFGPFLGAIPSAALILCDTPEKVIAFLIFILILQQCDGNIIKPKVLGKTIGLSSFWVIFAVLMFGGLFGVWGAVLGVPLFAFIYLLFEDKVVEKLRNKGIDSEQ